jgi:hypothetical protein
VESYLGGGLRGAEPCHKSGAHHDEGESHAGGHEQGEVGRLREEAAMLQQQLAQVMERLDKLASS